MAAGGRRLVPTWRMEEGECRDSLAMEVAAQCKLPPAVVARASHLYNVRTAPIPSPDTPPVSLLGIPRCAATPVFLLFTLMLGVPCWEHHASGHD